MVPAMDDVLIIGAGIGGLAAGVALARAGRRVTVCERAASLTEVGAGLQLGPNAGHVLTALGLDAAFAPVEVRPEGVRLQLGVSGATIATVPLGETARARYGAPYRVIHRADLVAVLAQALHAQAPDALVTNAELIACLQDDQGVTAVFADGAERRAAVLIGADGLRSTVQALLLRPQEPRFTGHAAWRGVVPASALERFTHPMEVVAAFGPHRHWVSYPIRGGALINFVAVTEVPRWREEAWSVRGDLTALRNAFAGWAAPASHVLNAAESVNLWAIADRAVLPRWTDGRVALLGDAAHPMPPFLAQGAGQALEDAAALATALRHVASTDIPQALKAYERRRRGRAERVRAASTANGQLYHRRGRLAQALSYAPIWAAAQLVPQAGLMRYDWLYGHDPWAPA